MSNEKALKSSIWYIISNFIIKAMAFLSTPIFTRILTKGEFGDFNNFMSWASLVTIFVTLSLEASLISARYDYKDDLDSYSFSIIMLVGVICASVLVFINIFSEFFVSLFTMDKLYLNILVVYVLFTFVITFFQRKEQFYFNYKVTVKLSLGVSITSIFISIFLVNVMNDGFKARVFGGFIPTLIIGFFLIVLMVRKSKQFSIKYWFYAIPICVPFIPHALSLTLLNSTDRIMIANICGKEETALYSLAYNVGTIITILLTSMNNAYSPWLAEKINEKKYCEIKRFSYVYIFVFVFFSVGIMLVAPEILFVLGGSQYMEAIYVLCPVTAGCTFQFLYTMFVNVEQIHKQTKYMAGASIIAAVVNIVLNYIFIPRYGYMAAAYTTLIGYLMLLLIHMFVVNIIGQSHVYNYLFVFVVIIIELIILPLISFMYSFSIIRYMIVLVYIMLLVIMVWMSKNKMLDKLQRNKR